MNFGQVVNTALVKAALSGYANSGMHNPHLHAQVATLLNDVILPRMPATLEQQLATALRLNPNGFGAVLIHYDPEVELSGSSNSHEYNAQEYLFNIDNPQKAVAEGTQSTEQILEFNADSRLVVTAVKIGRVLSIRRENQRELVIFPRTYPDFSHFSYTRRGDADILIEFPTTGAWNNEDLIVEAIPQFTFRDIGSPIDIPANTASYIITALAYELSAIYNPDRPELTAHLLRELSAGTQKAMQDMDDWTEARPTMSQKMNRFGRL